MAEFVKKTATLMGTDVVYHRGGAGEPMLYLHGGGVVDRVQPFMELLGRDLDLIVPQHPGMGESGVPDWLGSMLDMALFYHDFISHLGLTRVHLAGTSIGGWLAATIAYLDPSPWKSLVLACPGGLDNPAIPKGATDAGGARETLRRLIYDKELAERLAARIPEGADDSPQAKKNKATTKILAGPARHDPSMHKWLHRVKIPVQIIWGTHDTLMPVAYADEFKKYLPQAKVAIFDKCGHLPYTEYPEKYAQVILDFVRTAPRAAAA